MSLAYLAALSLPYLDVKTELHYEVEATGSTLAYEQLRFQKETESKAFLNMLVSVEHLRNGHSSVLKKHNKDDVLLLSLLLAAVHSYMQGLRKKTAKAYRHIVQEKVNEPGFEITE